MITYANCQDHGEVFTFGKVDEVCCPVCRARLPVSQRTPEANLAETCRREAEHSRLEGRASSPLPPAKVKNAEPIILSLGVRT